MTAERIIFYLGRMAVDDFGEILTLAGNGRGFGALQNCTRHVRADCHCVLHGEEPRRSAPLR